MTEAWRELKVGDRVRIVRLPTEPGTLTDEELIAVYRDLIHTGRVLTIEEIDEFGNPWVGWETGEPGQGDWHSQSLALNDNSWERFTDSVGAAEAAGY